MAKTITNANSIFTNGIGIVIGAGGDPATAIDGKLTIAVGGAIEANTLDFNGIYVNDIANANISVLGTVSSGTYGIYTTGSVGNLTISVGDTGYVSGIIGQSALKFSLKNAGLIDGNLQASSVLGCTITNSGTIAGDLVTYISNDKVTNTGFITGSIYLGGGNDVFTGGNNRDVVFDEGGNDKYKLGGGDDKFFAASLAGSNTGIDIVDGGNNNPFDYRNGQVGDIYYGSSTQQNYINLEKGWAGETAIVPLDGIKGFETIVGGAFGDVLWGDKNANHISGMDGGDVIIGGLGADWLQGGLGENIFHYNTFKDSAVAFKGRDTIVDFLDGADKISFGKAILQLPTAKYIAFESFSGDGTNVEIRAMKWGDHAYQIEVDGNGDGKADMAINVEVVDPNTLWSLDDFILNFV